jgi:hypothetical protein
MNHADMNHEGTKNTKVQDSFSSREIFVPFVSSWFATVGGS